MKVYISGPITGLKKEVYMKRFTEAGERAKKRNPECSIINPALICSNMPEGTTHDEYMKICLCLIDMCDVVCFMDGWTKSKGCQLEFQYAKSKGKRLWTLPNYYYEEDFN